MRVDTTIGFLLTVLIGALVGFCPAVLGADCNGNATPDADDVSAGGSQDCNENGIPDECEQAIVRLGFNGTFAVVSGRTSVFAAGDVDGDGDLDFLAGSSRSRGSEIDVYLSLAGDDGGGRVGDFAEPVSYAAGPSMRAMALGDVEGADGDLDIVLVTTSGTEILTNDGSGAFSEPESIPLRAPASDVHLTDLNGDGQLDAVVSHSEGGRSPQVSVLLKRGAPDGGFHPPQPLSSGAPTVALAIADMDGDGDVDIVTAETDPPGVSVFLNESCGPLSEGCAFSTAIRIPVPEKPITVRALPRGDAPADLVVASAETVFSLRNGGDGRSFETASFSITSDEVDVADLDSDGDLDVVSGAVQSVVVLVNGGDGRFESRVDFELSSPFSGLQPGDFDGDHAVDVAVVSTGKVAILENGLEPGVTFETSIVDTRTDTRAPHNIAIADFDGDGDQDILTVDGHKGFSTIINDLPAPLTHTPARLPPGVSESLRSIAVADYDQDGDNDMVVGTVGRGFLSHYDNEGDATFVLRSEVTIARGPLFLVTTDMNHDGWADVVSSAGGPDGLAILLNNGVGDFRPAVHYSTDDGEDGGLASLRTLNAEPGDFDGDGDIDLAVANGTFGTVLIFRNRGDGALDQSFAVDAGGDPEFVVAGDWNRDGFMDLATAMIRENSIGVLMHRGETASGRDLFEKAQLHPIGIRANSMVVGDLNGDDFLDIVSSSVATHNISVLLNDAGQGFSLGGHFKTGGQPRFAALGDIDGDGSLDIATGNRKTFDVWVFFNQLAQKSQPFSEHICTLRDFVSLALKGPRDRLTVKYTVPGADAASLLPPAFQNTKTHPLHHEFLGSVFPDHFPALSAQGLIGLTQVRATRQYFIGAVERLVTESRGPVFIYSIVAGSGPDEVLTLEEVRGVHEKLSQALTLRPLEYAPDPEGFAPLSREAAESWADPGFPIFLGTVDADVEFIPYTKGVGYGRVRLFYGEDFDAANESGRFTFQDVAVIDHAPRDIEGVVGGVATARPQGALSHVSVRTARRGTPNAFIDRAMAVFLPFEGQLVRFEVTETEFTVEEATQENAERFWSERTSLPEPRPFDAEYRGLDRFDEMEFSVSGAMEARFGGKASGLARLQTILTGPYEQYRERGFAIPMAYSLDFLRENTIASEVDGRELSYQAYLEELVGLDRFKTDSAYRFQALGDFRDFARKNGTLPEGLLDAIAQRIEEVFGSRQAMVRHRSSSNVEDILEFNGAGLYESTSVCVADSFDDDDVGPSHCDPTRNPERTIERALKKVWTSLWTFRAYEERSYFQIPQTSATMGILVNRTFLDEDANGVAFTGDPTSPRGGCYIVTAQVGEESVVSPEPGILPEVNILEVADGEVVRIVRSQRSTLVDESEEVLSDEKLRELGELMWHIDEHYPVDTGAEYDREDILLDLEFKLEPDGSLAVKQIRPFLIPGGWPERPTFELVIPEGAAACGGINLGAPSGDPETEYESKSLVRFRAGTHVLPSSRCVFSGELFEEVLVGPTQQVATPDGPGIYRATERRDNLGIRYSFNYRQTFSLPGGGDFEVRLFDLDFVPGDDALVFDDAFITFNLTMLGFERERQLGITYSSCDYRELPAWEVNFELEDGTLVELLERSQLPDAVTTTGRGALGAASVTNGGDSRRVTSYWDLVYSSARHNAAVRFWVILAPPVSIPGVDGDVHVIELHAADPPEVLDLVAVPQEAAAAYLDQNFEVIARPTVRSFSREVARSRFFRGDSNVDGSVNIADAIRTLAALFRDGEPVSCADAADANDDGGVNITDSVWTLLHLFGGRTLPEPTGGCGSDPTDDDLSCDSAPACF